MAPPARTITIALDMSKAFDTINIHTLIRKLLQTNIPGTIIKGCTVYTTYRNHTSKQRQFKTGVPQGMMGDFNANKLNELKNSSTHIHDFSNIFSTYYYYKLINLPTRERKQSSALLDNIYIYINIPDC